MSDPDPTQPAARPPTAQPPATSGDAGAQSRSPQTLVEEWSWYLRQWPGLLAGKQVPTYPIGGKPSAPVGTRSDEELRLLFDIATRQIASLDAQLEQIRQRAQFLFTTLLATTALASLVLRAVIADSGLTAVLAAVAWGLAVLLLVAALLGAAGVIVNNKVMGTVSASWLTRQTGEWLRAITIDAISAVEQSQETVANQLTYFRHAALLTILGSMLLCLTWITSTA